MDYWTDILSVNCAIVAVDETPGILLYSDFVPSTEPIDFRYKLMEKRAKTMETAAKQVSPAAEILFGKNTSPAGTHEFCLFIPAEVNPEDIAKLYYLMDTFTFRPIPAHMDWKSRDYAKFRANLARNLTCGPLSV